MAEKSFDQFLRAVQSGEPTDGIASVADVPQDRPVAWPKNLPEPIIIKTQPNDKSEQRQGIANAGKEGGDVYLFFHDPNNEGGIVAMTATDAREMFDNAFMGLTGLPDNEAVETVNTDRLTFFDIEGGKEVINEDVQKAVYLDKDNKVMGEPGIEVWSNQPISQSMTLIKTDAQLGDTVAPEDIYTPQGAWRISEYVEGPKDDPTANNFIEARDEYSTALNHFNGIPVNSPMNDEALAAAGITVQKYDVPEAPAVEPVNVAQQTGTRTRADAVAERRPEPVQVIEEPVPAVVAQSPQEVLDQQIAGDYPMVSLQGDENIQALYLSQEAFAGITHSLQMDPPDMDSVVQRFEGLPENFKPVVHQYLQDSIEKGSYVDPSPYEAAIDELMKTGDVDIAAQKMNGTYEDPALVAAQTVAPESIQPAAGGDDPVMAQIEQSIADQKANLHAWAAEQNEKGTADMTDQLQQQIDEFQEIKEQGVKHPDAQELLNDDMYGFTPDVAEACALNNKIEDIRMTYGDIQNYSGIVIGDLVETNNAYVQSGDSGPVSVDNDSISPELKAQVGEGMTAEVQAILEQQPALQEKCFSM